MPDESTGEPPSPSPAPVLARDVARLRTAARIIAYGQTPDSVGQATAEYLMDLADRIDAHLRRTL